jgi:hypothetical protein
MITWKVLSGERTLQQGPVHLTISTAAVEITWNLDQTAMISINAGTGKCAMLNAEAIVLLQVLVCGVALVRFDAD